MQHLVVPQLSEHIRLTRQHICWTATLMITQCYGWKNAGCWRSIMNARIGLISRTAFFFLRWETHIMTLGSELACQPNKTYKRLPNLDRTTQMIERLIKTSTPHRYFFPTSSTGPCGTCSQPPADGRTLPPKKNT